MSDDPQLIKEKVKEEVETILVEFVAPVITDGAYRTYLSHVSSRIDEITSKELLRDVVDEIVGNNITSDLEELLK